MYLQHYLSAKRTKPSHHNSQHCWAFPFQKLRRYCRHRPTVPWRRWGLHTRGYEIKHSGKSSASDWLVITLVVRGHGFWRWRRGWRLGSEPGHAENWAIHAHYDDPHHGECLIRRWVRRAGGHKPKPSPLSTSVGSATAWDGGLCRYNTDQRDSKISYGLSSCQDWSGRWTPVKKKALALNCVMKCKIWEGSPSGQISEAKRVLGLLGHLRKQEFGFKKVYKQK